MRMHNPLTIEEDGEIEIIAFYLRVPNNLRRLRAPDINDEEDEAVETHYMGEGQAEIPVCGEYNIVE